MCGVWGVGGSWNGTWVDDPRSFPAYILFVLFHDHFRLLRSVAQPCRMSLAVSYFTDFYCELGLHPIDGELSSIVHQEVLNGNQSADTKARKFLWSMLSDTIGVSTFTLIRQVYYQAYCVKISMRLSLPIEFHSRLFARYRV